MYIYIIYIWPDPETLNAALGYKPRLPFFVGKVTVRFLFIFMFIFDL